MYVVYPRNFHESSVSLTDDERFALLAPASTITIISVGYGEACSPWQLVQYWGNSRDNLQQHRPRPLISNGSFFRVASEVLVHEAEIVTGKGLEETAGF
jgi:hypothetical protein